MSLSLNLIIFFRIKMGDEEKMEESPPFTIEEQEQRAPLAR